MKSNNRLENLEWMTAKENTNYGTRNKLVSMALKGKPRSDETKRKISESQKGKHLVLGDDGKRHWFYLET